MEPEITRLIEDWKQGDEEAGNTLFDAIYRNLTDIAQTIINARPNQTMEAGDLVHQLFANLKINTIKLESRSKLYSFCAKVMRNILLDHLRARTRKKRDAGKVVTFDDNGIAPSSQLPDLIEAIDNLAGAKNGPVLLRVVDLHFYLGLTIEETAEVMEMSRSSVKRHWSAVKIYLRECLAQEE